MMLHEAEALAWKHMKAHQLPAQGWTFDFNYSKRSLGICNFGTKEILLSVPFTLANGIEQTEDTILHEIAHALAGYKAGHGPEWKRMCRRVGANPSRLAHDAEHLESEYKLISICPNGHKKFASKQPKGERSCGSCSRKFDRRFLLKFTINPQYNPL
jgi:SprT protein